MRARWLRPPQLRLSTPVASPARGFGAGPACPERRKEGPDGTQPSEGWHLQSLYHPDPGTPGPPSSALRSRPSTGDSPSSEPVAVCPTSHADPELLCRTPSLPCPPPSSPDRPLPATTAIQVQRFSRQKWQRHTAANGRPCRKAGRRAARSPSLEGWPLRRPALWPHGLLQPARAPGRSGGGGPWLPRAPVRELSPKASSSRAALGTTAPVCVSTRAHCQSRPGAFAQLRDYWIGLWPIITVTFHCGSELEPSWEQVLKGRRKLRGAQSPVPPEPSWEGFECNLL